MKNLNKFMTPLYASPAIIQKKPVVNYYLEDVFSLGVSFLQMCGPFTSDELQSFFLNGSNSSDLTHTSLTPRLDLALQQCQPPLTYFQKALLTKMLSFESEERPTFLELRDIINAKQLLLNLNNEAYVEGLLKEKIN
jgi:serine/threonine protein kinase